MHKDFVSWYRPASVSPSAELLEARWKGVEAAVAGLSATTVVALAKLFFGIDGAQDAGGAFLETTFNAAESPLSAKDNSEELRILAGAVLRNTIEEEKRLGLTVASGLVAGSFANNSDPASIEHVDRAREFIASEALDTRKVGSEPKAPAPLSTETLEKRLPAAHFAQAQTQNLREPLVKFINDEIQRQTSTFIKSAWQGLRAQREEIDMLWWLQARVSRDSRVPFEGLSGAQGALALPKELFDLTAFLPGPQSIEGLLLAALSSARSPTEEVSVAEAVNANSRVWREGLSTKYRSSAAGALCPIWLAIVKSLDTDGETDWFPVFKKLSRLDLEKKYRRIDIAAQLYSELTFLDLTADRST